MKTTALYIFCFFIYLKICFSVFYTQAQNTPIELQGKICDNTLHTPIPYAIISTQKNGNFVTHTAGNFTLQIKYLPDTLTIEHTEYSTLQIPIANSAQSVDFDCIMLFKKESLLPQILVQAQYIPAPLATQTAAIEVLTPKQWQQNPSFSVAQTLNTLAGVQMQQGAYNTNKLTIRGIGSRTQYGTSKIRAFLDEIPLNNGNGETFIDDLDLQELKQIEVIKGAQSSLYGANLGGVLRLHTPKSNANALKTNLYVADFGTYKLNNQLFLSNEKANIYVGYTQAHSDGYRQNSAFNRKSLTILSQIWISPQQSIQILANQNTVKAYIPSSVDSLTFATTPQNAATNWAAVQGNEQYTKQIMGITHHFFAPKKWQWHNTLYATAQNANEVRPFNTLIDNNLQIGYRSNVQYTTAITPNLQATCQAGFEWLNEKYNWQTYQTLANGTVIGNILSNNAEKRLIFNTFAQASVRIKNRLELQIGTNYNTTQYLLTDLYFQDSINLSSNYTYKPIFSPRLGFNYTVLKPQNANQLYWYGSVAHGFSMPTLAETLTPTGTINPDIKPETGWNVETGLRGSVFKARTNFNICAYNTLISNLLVARRTDFDTYIGLNAGSTQLAGIEASIQQSIIKKTQNTVSELNIWLNYAYNNSKFLNFIDDTLNYSNNKLTGVPPQQINAGIQVQFFKHFFINTNMQHLANFFINDANTVKNKQYTVLNAQVGYHNIFFKKLNINVLAGATNLTNQKYASLILINAPAFANKPPRYYYPALPLQWYAQVGVQYHF